LGYFIQKIFNRPQRPERYQDFCAKPLTKFFISAVAAFIGTVRCAGSEDSLAALDEE
jgi:hypothetical protein